MKLEPVNVSWDEGFWNWPWANSTIQADCYKGKNVPMPHQLLPVFSEQRFLLIVYTSARDTQKLTPLWLLGGKKCYYSGRFQGLCAIPTLPSTNLFIHPESQAHLTSIIPKTWPVLPPSNTPCCSPNMSRSYPSSMAWWNAICATKPSSVPGYGIHLSLTCTIDLWHLQILIFSILKMFKLP